ncbi:thiamine phosphate synthase [Thalassolituus sp. LLYu03]|uniref:thiamine phosphate synthase n=1 Tax=Thalassolituus sp. LLYu03 TaxID=3421656 RepID=UPI003D27DB1D
MKRPMVWSIGASDTTAGAGCLADVRVAHAAGCDCAVLLTAITAQSSAGVHALQLVSRAMLEQQWQALKSDGWPAVIRLGWLAQDAGLLDWLLDKLAEFQGPVLWDPVLSATQGGLSASAWPEGRLTALLQRVTLLTPNAREARALARALSADDWSLAGLTADSLTGAEAASGLLTARQAAEVLQAHGAGHVLVTGGDEAQALAQVRDTFFAARPQDSRYQTLVAELPGPSLLPAFTLQHPRLARRVHGTGCHLTAGIACALAQGHTLYDAVVRGVVTARLAIQQASSRANGYDNAWACDPEAAGESDWPVVLSPDGDEPFQSYAFTAAGPLGLYGLTDNLEHLQRLLSLGIDTLQWRVKDRSADYETDMVQAIALCRAAGVPLYINDDWRLALKLGAYGVHLGQEDLLTADCQALAAAGLRLGISTHSDWEIARARALTPSYIAFGPVYIPLSKRLRYAPLGLTRVSTWAARFSARRLTCIGGITPDNLLAVASTGIESVAIVTALREDEGLEQRVHDIRRFFPPLRATLGSLTTSGA